MSLERERTTTKRAIDLNGQSTPIINIIDINHLRTELDGSKREWAELSTKRPSMAPARVLATPKEIVNLVRASCRTDKRTGELLLSEIFVPGKVR